MGVNGSSTKRQVLWSLGWTMGCPAALNFLVSGRHGWVELGLWAVLGYLVHATYRGRQRENVLRTLYIRMSDEFAEVSDSYEHWRWEQAVDVHRRIMFRWAIPWVTADDKCREV